MAVSPAKVWSTLPFRLRSAAFEGAAGFVAAFLGTLSVDAAFALDLGAGTAAMIAGATAAVDVMQELATDVRDRLREHRHAYTYDGEATDG